MYCKLKYNESYHEKLSQKLPDVDDKEHETNDDIKISLIFVITVKRGDSSHVISIAEYLLRDCVWKWEYIMVILRITSFWTLGH